MTGTTVALDTQVLSVSRPYSNIIAGTCSHGEGGTGLVVGTIDRVFKPGTCRSSDSDHSMVATAQVGCVVTEAVGATGAVGCAMTGTTVALDTQVLSVVDLTVTL